MKRMIAALKASRLVALLMAGLIAGAVALPAVADDHGSADNAGPAIWTAAGSEGTVHLFGSMHLLRKGTEWRSPAFEQVLDEATHLVLEIELDEAGEAAVRQFITEHGIHKPGRTLKDDLPAELYADLVKTTTDFGIPEQAIAPMKPWHAALMVSMVTIQRLGFDPALGVEHSIMTEADGREIPFSGLETPRDQLSSMANQPADVQEDMVRDALRQLHEIGDMLDALTVAWLAGDTNALQDLLIGSFEPYPELYEAVLVERNRRWLPEIMALLEEPGNHLVVVGSAHLLGDDSVIAMLRDAGVTVKRHDRPE